jgi:hypothetical protein
MTDEQWVRLRRVRDGTEKDFRLDDHAGIARFTQETNEQVEAAVEAAKKAVPTRDWPDGGTLRIICRAAIEAYEATTGDGLEAAYERGWNAAAELSQRLGEPVRAYPPAKASDTNEVTRATVSDEDVRKFWRTYNELRNETERD